MATQRTDPRMLEFHVGALTLLALGFFAWFILFVGDLNPFGGSYMLLADFNEIQLLQRGDPVRKNGLIIGKVDAFEFVGNRVRVTLLVDRPYEIRKDATVAVGNVGLFGANYIKVTEPELAKGKESPGVYRPGDVIEGKTAPEFETLLNESNRLLADLRGAVKSLDSILSDPRLKENLIEATQEMRDATAAGRRSLEKIETSLDRIMGDAESTMESARKLVDGEGGLKGALEKLNDLIGELDGIASDNRQGLRRTVEAVRDVVEELRERALAEHVAEAAEQLSQVGRELAGFLRELNNNGETPERIRRITERVEKITGDLSELTGTTKEAIQESDLKGSLSRAFDDVHTIASRVDEMGGKLGSIKTEVMASLFYSDGADDFHPDLNASIGFGDKAFALLGVEDIGGTDDLNLQVGYSLGRDHQVRVGIVADEFGIGYDRYLFGKFVQLRLEAYRPDDLLFRYAARFRALPDTFVTYRQEDDPVGSGHTSYVGIERRF